MPRTKKIDSEESTDDTTEESTDDTTEESTDDTTESNADITDLGDDSGVDSSEDDSDTTEDAGSEGLVEITYHGLKVPANKQPLFVTIIVPDDGSDAADPNVSITEGLTLTLKREVPASVPAEAADWLFKHPAYDIS